MTVAEASVWRRLRGRGRAMIRVLSEAFIEYERDRAMYLATAILYYAGIAAVPLLLLLLSILGLLLRYSATAGQVEQQMLAGIEQRFGTELADTMTRLLDAVQRDSITATIVSVVGMLVSASLLFRQLRLTFRAVWHYDPPLVAGSFLVRVLSLVREWVIAVVITLGGGGLLMIALGVIAAFAWAARLLARMPIVPPSGQLLAALSSFVIATITFGALLKVLPPRAVRWRDIGPAVLLCAAVWVGASELLPLYHRLVGDGVNAYNAIGAILPLLLLAKIGSQMLFYAAELCKVVTQRRTSTSPDVAGGSLAG